MQRSTTASAARTVLVVEDDPNHRLIISDLLSFAGHAVIPAANARVAVPFARHFEPDLVVLDLCFNTVPEGVGVLEELRQDPRTQQIPVVVYSGFTNRYEERLRELGLDAIVAKGHTDQLMQQVKSLLARANGASHGET